MRRERVVPLASLQSASAASARLLRVLLIRCNRRSSSYDDSKLFLCLFELGDTVYDEMKGEKSRGFRFSYLLVLFCHEVDTFEIANERSLF